MGPECNCTKLGSYLNRLFSNLCGILDRWLSNINETQIPNVSYAANVFIGGQLKWKGMAKGCFVVWLAMENLVGKKAPV